MTEGFGTKAVTVRDGYVVLAEALILADQAEAAREPLRSAFQELRALASVFHATNATTTASSITPKPPP